MKKGVTFASLFCFALLGTVGCAKHDAPLWIENQHVNCEQDGPLAACPVHPPRFVHAESLAIYHNSLWVVDHATVWRVDNFDSSSPIPQQIDNPANVSFQSIAATEQSLYATQSENFLNSVERPGVIFKLNETGMTWEPIPQMQKHCPTVVADRTEVFAFCVTSQGNEIWSSTGSGWSLFADLHEVDMGTLVLTNTEIAGIQSYSDLKFKIIDRQSREVHEGDQLKDPPIQINGPLGGEGEEISGGTFVGIFEGRPARLLKRDGLTLLAQDDRVISVTAAGARDIPLKLEDAPVTQFAAVGKVLFANPGTISDELTHAPLFFKTFVFRSDDLGNNWVATNLRASTFSIAARSKEKEWVALIKPGARLFRSSDEGRTWQPAPDLGSDEIIDEICASGDRLYATVNVPGGKDYLGDNPSRTVFVSDHIGDRFHQAAIIPVKQLNNEKLICNDEDVVLINQGWVSHRPLGTDEWSKVYEGITITPRQGLLVAGNLYLLADRIADHGLYHIPMKNGEWQQIDPFGRSFDDFWVASDDPRVIVATRGFWRLSWSNDGGKTFSKDTSLSQSQLFEAGGYLWGRSNNQLFAMKEKIPRPLSWTPVLTWIKENKGSVSWIFVLAIFLGILPTRIILIILTLDIPPFREAARIFYATSFGRTRLFNPYRRSLLRRQDITVLATQYIDLPISRRDAESLQTLISIAAGLDQLTENQNVLIVGGGGSGKTTLCWHLAQLAADGQLRVKRLPSTAPIPVFINGFAYDGDLVDAITISLKRNHAYVNRSIVETQLELGGFVLLFDGYSEIQSTVASAGKANDIVTIVSKYPDCFYVFTSRTSLPSDLCAALGDVCELEFAELNDAAQEELLQRYLKRGEAAAALYKELRERYPNLKWIPLMLKLAAHYYNKNGFAPRAQFAFFEDYARDILAPGKLGLKDSAGIHFAIEHIVLHTHIETGGSTGFLLDDAIQLLVQINEMLDKGFGVTLAASSLMQLLHKAGLFLSGGAYWKFFHDSFETYYAARVLEKEFRRHRSDLFAKVGSSSRLQEAVALLRESLNENDRRELDRLQSSKEQTQAHAAQ
ncbi:MAG TPA: NACHT domain-containing protein [Candidatus Angelobacter sp.]